jgi:hypothetical protein
MATDDTTLISEARAITDYDTEIMSDSEFQELVDIAKEELRAEWQLPDYQFYGNTTSGDIGFILQRDRALFWYVCIAAKIRGGEIAAPNITIGSIRATSYTGSKFDFYFENLDKRLSTIERSSGPRITQITRDDERAYEFDPPESDNTS